MTFCKSLFNGGVALVAALSLVSCAKKDTHFTSGSGATFYVDSINGSFTPDELNSNEKVNRKFANFTACLKDNAMTSAIMNLKFQVSAGAVTSVKRTDERGCIVWQELITYDPYENEKQILLTRSITALEGHSGTENVNFAYNPWNGDSIVYLKREAARAPENVTLNYGKGGEIVRRNSATGESSAIVIDFLTTIVASSQKQSLITDMSMEFLKRDFDNYAVNPALNLTIAHKYRLRFSSALIRRTLSDGNVTEGINAGRFKFHFVILKEGYDPRSVPDSQLLNYVVAAQEFDASASLGRFIADVALKFRNVSALASRMTGVLTITSLDQPGSFAESTFEGLLSPISGGSNQGISLIPSSMNARDLLTKTRRLEAQQANLTGLQLFDAHSGYTQVSRDPVVVKSPGFLMDSEVKVDVFGTFKKLRAGQKLVPAEQKLFLRALCDKYFNGVWTQAMKTAYDQCVLYPESMMQYAVREFVERVDNPVPRKVGPPVVESLGISIGMDFSEAQANRSGTSSSRSFSLGAGIGAEIGLPGAISGLLSQFGIGISGSIGAKFSAGKEWFSSSGITTSSGNSTGVSANRSVNVAAEGFKFAIDVTSRACFLMGPTAALESHLNGKAHPAGRYFCADDVQRGAREEVYYFLNQASGLSSSPLSDNLSAEDNPWRMFIRGSKTYNLFANLFAQKNVKLVLQKMPDQQILDQFNEFYVTQEFPGMLTPR